MDVIYVGQQLPVWEICGNMLNFPKFDEFLPHFLYRKILHRRNFLTKGL